MSHFYGTVNGGRSDASRCGHKTSGMETYCASWKGAIRCFAYVEDGVDMVRVEKVSWKGVGEYELLFQGPMG